MRSQLEKKVQRKDLLCFAKDMMLWPVGILELNTGRVDRLEPKEILKIWKNCHDVYRVDLPGLSGAEIVMYEREKCYRFVLAPKETIKKACSTGAATPCRPSFTNHTIYPAQEVLQD